MVLIEDITETRNREPSPSQQRLLDADEIEGLVSQLKRPTARLQVETLVKKMRKEAASLKALEATNDLPTTKAVPAAPAAAPVPQPIPTSPATSSPATAPSVVYTNIDKFAFDAGGYNEKFVTLYLPLPGVGSIPKDQITCTFSKDAFDVTVMNLNGKNYRLKKDSLEHDIVPESSKYIVKADKIVVKLQKVKGEYGSFDYWSKLTDPKRKDKKNSDKSNPAASITEMMKEMYDNGDDNMRKIIGETMLKQRNGELGKDSMMDGGLGADDF
ncbi:calcyclin-binding protein [Nitzschia inconspicua]|uniref:Calcyclin-binding protein n=1 Tax=Nitzschia inconspicua TaxID=303405 RepID=A0A9K3LI54_9STRA|nr:calcyclin-binding protein [Nitzschia inconspicua]